MKKYKFRLLNSLKASIDIKAFNDEFLQIRGDYLNDKISDEEFKEAVKIYYLFDELIYKNYIRVENKNNKRKRIKQEEYKKNLKEF